MSLENQIICVLKTIVDPFSKVDIVTKEIVQGLQVSSEGRVSFILDINPEYMNEGLALKQKAEELLSALPNVTSVQIALTAQRHQQAHTPSKQGIKGIHHIIAIASGKGGVGKSTTAVNLASGLQTLGLKIGILDADVYGPSIPRLLGVNQRPTSDDGQTMNPIVAHGLKCMSMGFMMDETTAAIWRGPMVQSAFNQMLRQVNWGDLDVLVIDLPPGTGDVQLTLAQTVLLSGAIIVSTPQDLALIDARRGLEMFVKVNIPVLGLIENMSYFLCPHCNKRFDIFEHGGVRKQAEAMKLPFIAEIPLHMSIREASENGTPIVYQTPLSPEALTYKELAKSVWASLTTSSS